MATVAESISVARDLLDIENLVAAIEAARRHINGEPESTIFPWPPLALAPRAIHARCKDTMAANQTPPSSEIPQWDGAARTLRFQGVVLKRYRRDRAENQMAVLAAFEEDGWPCSIDAPFHESKIRETVRSLNKAIGRTAAIRFFANGTGERIGWEAR